MKVLLFSFILLLSAQVSSSQTSILSVSNDEIKFDLDYAAFRSDSGAIMLEMYYSFSRLQFKFVDQDSQRIAQFKVQVEIFENDSLIHHRNWSSQSTVAESPAIRNGRFLSLSRFILPPGEYRFVTKINDLNSDREGRLERELILEGVPEHALSISDIELAESVTADSSGGIFTKNNREIVPNPTSVYGYENSVAYFCAEIYNLVDSIYTIKYNILNEDYSVFRTFPPKTTAWNGRQVTEVGGFNVVSFPTGSYFIQLEVSDSSGQRTATRSKKFYVIKQPPSHASSDSFVSSNVTLRDFGQKKLDEIDDEFHSASYLATKDEKKVYKALNLNGKRRFMVQFWSKHVGRREEHLQSLKFANLRFSSLKAGWKTDRGRVVIKFGEPDEVDKNANLGGKRSYEIWQYYSQQGGLTFVFVDKQGNDDLELVHSNAPTEVSDPDWRRWIE